MMESLKNSFFFYLINGINLWMNIMIDDYKSSVRRLYGEDNVQDIEQCSNVQDIEKCSRPPTECLKLHLYVFYNICD